MKDNTQSMTHATISLTDVENYISARFPEHAQPGQRYACVITTKQVIEFIAARESMRRLEGAELKVDPKVCAARDTANSNKETAHTAWSQAEEQLSGLQMRNALHRFLTRKKIAEAIQARDDAKAKFEAAKVAANKAHAAYSEAHQSLIADRDLKVAEGGKEVAMMRQAITKAIADAMAATPSPTTAEATEATVVDTIHGIVRDEFINREVFKEAVIAIILEQFATGKKDVLVSEDIFKVFMRNQDCERDLNAKGYHCHASVASFLMTEVSKRVGLTFLIFSYKMAGNSENYGPAYITVK